MKGSRSVRVALAAAFAVASAVAGLTVPSSAARASTWQTVINGSFASTSTLQRDWNYNYPWGDTHNGSAKMLASQVSASGGVLTETAVPVSGEGSIHYHSGTIWAKTEVTVDNTYPNWEVRGDFEAPAQTGAWPAFWLSGATSWPPESDILEYKGNNVNWFNTFRTSSDVSTTTVNVSSPGNWHTYRAWISQVSSSDVHIDYYIDGVWQAEHDAAGFVGKPMWIIIDLQTEGSSGSPGPTGTTSFRARNLYVGRSYTG
jgi:hypothetical protein